MIIALIAFSVHSLNQNSQQNEFVLTYSTSVLVLLTFRAPGCPLAAEERVQGRIGEDACKLPNEFSRHVTTTLTEKILFTRENYSRHLWGQTTVVKESGNVNMLWCTILNRKILKYQMCERKQLICDNNSCVWHMANSVTFLRSFWLLYSCYSSCLSWPQDGTK